MPLVVLRKDSRLFDYVVCTVRTHPMKVRGVVLVFPVTNDATIKYKSPLSEYEAHYTTETCQSSL